MNTQNDDYTYFRSQKSFTNEFPSFMKTQDIFNNKIKRYVEKMKF